MKEEIKMFLGLFLTTALCSLILASVYEFSKERIVIQKLKYTKGPVLKNLLKEVTNEPLKERMVVNWKGKKINLFIGKKENQTTSVVIETFSKGYGGVIEVLTAFDIQNSKCKGIGITDHKETVGIGAKIVEPFFTDLFKDISLESKVALKTEGGEIDGIAGATISSKAVCRAVAEAMEIYKSYSDSLKRSFDNEKNN